MVSAETVFLAATTFQIIFTLPTLFDRGSTVPRETSIPTAIVWLVYGVTYFTISYPLAGIASIVGGTLWGLVALFRARSSEQEIDYNPSNIIPGD